MHTDTPIERLYRHRFEFCNVKPTWGTFCNFKCNFETTTWKQKAHIALSREIWILTALWADVWQITISLSTVWRKQLFNIFQQLHGLVLEGKQGIPETTDELHGHNATVSSGPEECAFRQNGRSKPWFYVPLTKAHRRSHLHLFRWILQKELGLLCSGKLNCEKKPW